MIFDLITDFARANAAIPAGHRAAQTMKLLGKALLQDVHFIAQHPTALFQSLWNSGWWHEERAAVGAGDATSGDLRLRPLLENWCATRDQDGCVTPWLRSLRPPETPLNTAPRFVLRGFDGRIDGVAFSKNGRRIATASSKSIFIWDTQSGQHVLTLKGHDEAVTGVAYLSGDRLVSTSADATLRIWNAHTAESSCVLKGHEKIIGALAVAPAAHRIVSGSDDGSVIIWDLDSLTPSYVIRAHETRVTALTCTLDGRFIATAGANDPTNESKAKTVRIWDGSRPGEPIAELSHPVEVRALAFSPSGNEVATGAVDGVISLWEVPSGKFIAEWRAHPARITCIIHSPDGSRIFSGAYDATVNVWNRQPLYRIGEFRGHALPVDAIAVSPDGGCIASGSSDETVRGWDTHAAIRGARPVNNGLLHCVCFSPDGARIAGGDDRLVHVWDTETGQELSAWHGHAGAVNSVAFSPDGERIASGSADQTIRVWHSRSGDVLAVLHGHEYFTGEIAFTADGSEVRSVKQDGRIFAWNATTGEKIERAGEENVSKRDNAPQFPIAMIKPRKESEVQYLKAAAAVAWHPEGLWNIACHPSGRLWAGSMGGSLRILKLEDLDAELDMSVHKMNSTDEMFDVIQSLGDTIAAAAVRYAGHQFSQQTSASRKPE